MIIAACSAGGPARAPASASSGPGDASSPTPAPVAESPGPEADAPVTAPLDAIEGQVLHVVEFEDCTVSINLAHAARPAKDWEQAWVQANEDDTIREIFDRHPKAPRDAAQFQALLCPSGCSEPGVRPFGFSIEGSDGVQRAIAGHVQVDAGAQISLRGYTRVERTVGTCGAQVAVDAPRGRWVVGSVSARGEVPDCSARLLRQRHFVAADGRLFQVEAVRMTDASVTEAAQWRAKVQWDPKHPRIAPTACETVPLGDDDG